MRTIADAWYKVDNVAKIFLATATRRDPRVFRISCTLNEPIQPEVLNEALRLTAKEFPQFQTTLHRGLFWHYFEPSDHQPYCKQEHLPPCMPLYTPERSNQLLYWVTYYGARINLEMFHALTDGNGGLVFLKAIVQRYLMLRFPKALCELPSVDSASIDDRQEDGFRKFYGRRTPSLEKPRRAYHIHSRRLPYDQTQYFQAHLSARQLLERSRALGVTMTSYLGAALMIAVYAEMPALERGMPIGISMPVNLRNYYPSATARNFFNSVTVSLVLENGQTLAELAPVFDARLRELTVPDAVRARMDGYEKLEHIPGIRPVPLFLKNPAVSFFSRRSNAAVTMVLSNLGRIQVPEALQPYIKGFSAYNTTRTMFTAVCSYGDDLVLGTASAYRSTNVLRRFYRSLAEDGIDVTLYASEVEE
ncbi:MAG: hypothetical protein ACI4JC_01315 [Faecalibacterium sp.]